jgi:hypothetical protein
VLVAQLVIELQSAEMDVRIHIEIEHVGYKLRDASNRRTVRTPPEHVLQSM